MEDWKKNYTKVEEVGWQRTQDSLIEEKRAKDGWKACTIIYIYTTQVSDLDFKPFEHTL